ncbi:MAG: glycine--tRNA ligase, partial [Planctomycetes bacterium]|nr:glycine--tRNA ligase [Planctomycetota bacterium]
VGLWIAESQGDSEDALREAMEILAERTSSEPPDSTIIPESYEDLRARMGKMLNIKGVTEVINWGHGGDELRTHAHEIKTKDGRRFAVYVCDILFGELPYAVGAIPSPYTGQRGSLTEPRQFNLMFESHAGAVQDDANKVYLRPETAQGIFVNFKNVMDSSRVKIPFGIAQIGKAFRNEINPRNFTFRSREFEQMEIEFFCHPNESQMWYEFWRDVRIKWYESLNIKSENLRPREQGKDELAHYSDACTDIEYLFPFSNEPQELEGIAHRGDFDLKAHGKAAKGKENAFAVVDDATHERFVPHVIEPSAGVDRFLLASITEAYTFDETRASPEFMKFHPRLAPIKAAVFPLVAKDGMPEVAEPIFAEIKKHFVCQYDAKQSIGKRYARMDEAGTPFCFTIDGQSKEDGTITVRNRDDASQERIDKSRCLEYLRDKLGL